MSLYVSSKIKHRDMWIELRNQGIKITSSWIDVENDPNLDYSTLWDNICRDISRSRDLLFYAIPEDIGHITGCLFEAGYAMGCGKRIHVVLEGIQYDPINERRVGTWLSHKNINHYSSIKEVLEKNHNFDGYDRELDEFFRDCIHPLSDIDDFEGGDGSLCPAKMYEDGTVRYMNHWPYNGIPKDATHIVYFSK